MSSSFSSPLKIETNVEVSHVLPSTLSLPNISDTINSSSNINNITLPGGYDIDNYIYHIHDINDFTKFMILTNHWVPGTTYQFPYSEHVKRDRVEKRRPNHNHLS